MRGLVLIVMLSSISVLVGTGQESVLSSERAARLKDEYPFVRFSLLADFPVPALATDRFALSPHAAAPVSGGEVTVPPQVQALDGRRVSVRGYMLPVDLRGDRVSTFLLTASIDSCHFGTVGQANEWIMVMMGEGRTVPFPRAVPITVFGRLSVRPEVRGEALVRLYSMVGDAIAVH